MKTCDYCGKEDKKAYFCSPAHKMAFRRGNTLKVLVTGGEQEVTDTDGSFNVVGKKEFSYFNPVPKLGKK